MRAARLTASVLALAFGGAGASAQTQYPSPYPAAPSPYTVQPISDADQLAAEIRLLAADPRNLQALVRAGELALKLDDDTAAGAFFARAERIDPHNARVKAGEGSLLVSGERPGEALRLFGEAERLGADPRSFAADRGLAYDLVGEQERAQRDYRLALKGGANDETQRRYALSLGISGKKDLALKQIDLLLRKSDRGAWRARAFILAMGGDKAGAEKIATSMMPAGMAQGLQPFFQILPGLRPADRAFAVHFGEVRPSAERLADARMVPPLAALAADPTAPVAVAAVAKPVVVVDAREERRRAREAKRNRGRTEVAALTTPPPQPLPGPPAYAGEAPTPAYTGPSYSAHSAPYAGRGSRAVIAANTASAHAAALPTPARVALPYPATSTPTAFVQRVPTAPPERGPATGSSAQPTRGVAPRPYVATNVASAVPTVTPAGASRSVAPAATGSTWPAAPGVAGSTPAARASSSVAAANLAAASPAPTPVPTPAPNVIASTAVPRPASSAPAVSSAPATAPSSGFTAAAETSSIVTPTPATTPTPAQVAAVALPPRPSPTPVRSEESILASIISDIKVPGSELAADSTPAPRATEPAARPIADDTAERAATEERAAKKRAADLLAAEKRDADKLAAEKKVADKKIADKKALADKKVADAKKAAADKKIADAKAAAAAEEKRKHDPKLLEPSRVWVQVAGGANEQDLPKQWAKLRSANAKAFGGKSGWTTPLRATNRILTGPFKSDDEAQSFVNAIAKDGLSGFVFVSDDGQKITKLGAK